MLALRDDHAAIGVLIGHQVPQACALPGDLGLIELRLTLLAPGIVEAIPDVRLSQLGCS